MEAKKKVRMDQYLSAVRIFKTRSQAAEACGKGRITVNGTGVKPSYTVKIGEEIEYRDLPITRTFRVKGLLAKRVSAAVAAEYVEETTPPGEIEKLKLAKTMAVATRDRGSGRPTKRERRELERFKKSTL